MKNKEKARQLLPLLRQAIVLKAKLWDIENEMEQVLGQELSEFATDAMQGWTVGFDRPHTLAHAKTNIKLDAALEIVNDAGDYCDTCGEDLELDDGEGYDGNCGNCADKRERRRRRK